MHVVTSDYAISLGKFQRPCSTQFPPIFPALCFFLAHLHKAKNEISCGHEIWHFIDCSPPILWRIGPNVIARSTYPTFGSICYRIGGKQSIRKCQISCPQDQWEISFYALLCRQIRCRSSLVTVPYTALSQRNSINTVTQYIAHPRHHYIESLPTLW